MKRLVLCEGRWSLDILYYLQRLWRPHHVVVISLNSRKNFNREFRFKSNFSEDADQALLLGNNYTLTLELYFVCLSLDFA